MTYDVLTLDRRNIHGTDTNSLLRMYDVANEIFNKSRSQQERTRAGKTIGRIANELQKRNVPL
jgi:hypothetical protein